EDAERVTSALCNECAAGRLPAGSDHIARDRDAAHVNFLPADRNVNTLRTHQGAVTHVGDRPWYKRLLTLRPSRSLDGDLGAGGLQLLLGGVGGVLGHLLQ